MKLPPLRFRAAFFLLLAITIADFLIPDLIPFVDEIVLALVTMILGLWRDRRGPRAGQRLPDDRSISATVVWVLVPALSALVAESGCLPWNGRTASRESGVEAAWAAPAPVAAAAPAPAASISPALNSTASPAITAPDETASSEAAEVANPWAGQARNALVAPCGTCHQSTLATSKPAALAVFDLDAAQWSATMTREQLESLGGRARGSTALSPKEKDAIARFLGCALEGNCVEE